MGWMVRNHMDPVETCWIRVVSLWFSAAFRGGPAPELNGRSLWAAVFGQRASRAAGAAALVLPFSCRKSSESLHSFKMFTSGPCASSHSAIELREARRFIVVQTGILGGFGTEWSFRKKDVHEREREWCVTVDLQRRRWKIRHRSLIWTYSRPTKAGVSSQVSEQISKSELSVDANI